MIQNRLQNIQYIWMMFTTILMITIQQGKRKTLIVLHDMIADIMANKKFQAIIQ